MKLPNKAISYKKSVLPLFPIILDTLHNSYYSPRELYQKLNKSFSDQVFG